ncbi:MULTISPECIES: creatininase family protein [unclassified Aureimonas]|uniref:creatininase family protein n=1 Tax=unclassified Aureimonas TaxID=2615206 RepID=UPI0006F5EF67|nr:MULTISPECIES: creatininase family protein [unclassified Aureimonas]KQT66183.1 creatininase [Aureimonas sp. Leaf427]KQT72371.1 creatininase [Aureimonas sp. Leaf460]
MHRRFEELTTVDLRVLGASLAGVVAVLPVAAVEQHGPHLPLGTDAMIAEGMIAKLLEKLDEAAPVTVLEPLRIGASIEHSNFPGTLDLGFAPMSEAIVAIGRSLHAAGFRRLAVVSSHGGNTPSVDAAALVLRRSLGLLVATASWMRFGVPEGLLPAEELAHGIHGGAVETALMLHFRPDLVRSDRIAPAPSLQARLERDNLHLRAHGRLGFGWMASDLNASGVVGNAGLGTAEMGRRIAEHQAARFAEFLGDAARFDLAVFD